MQGAIPYTHAPLRVAHAWCAQYHVCVLYKAHIDSWHVRHPMHLPHEGQHVARYTVCASHHATLGACSTLCARPCLRMTKKAKKPLELFGHALFKSVQKAWEHPRRRPNMHKGSCQPESTHAHPRRIQTHPEASMTIWKATMTIRSVMECPDCSKVNCIGVNRLVSSR